MAHREQNLQFFLQLIRWTFACGRRPTCRPGHLCFWRWWSRRPVGHQSRPADSNQRAGVRNKWPSDDIYTLPAAAASATLFTPIASASILKEQLRLGNLLHEWLLLATKALGGSAARRPAARSSPLAIGSRQQVALSHLLLLTARSNEFNIAIDFAHSLASRRPDCKFRFREPEPISTFATRTRSLREFNSHAHFRRNEHALSRERQVVARASSSSSPQWRRF